MSCQLQIRFESVLVCDEALLHSIYLGRKYTGSIRVYYYTCQRICLDGNIFAPSIDCF